MQEIGNITAFVSFNILLALMAYWLLLLIVLYNRINCNEDKINDKNRKGMNQFRIKKVIALSPVCITIMSLINIGVLAVRINEDLANSIIAIVLNIIFYIGAILSLVMYVKIKRDNNKDVFRIKKYNYLLAFTTIVIFTADIYTYIWSK